MQRQKAVEADRIKEPWFFPASVALAEFPAIVAGGVFLWVFVNSLT